MAILEDGYIPKISTKKNDGRLDPAELKQVCRSNLGEAFGGCLAKAFHLLDGRCPPYRNGK